MLTTQAFLITKLSSTLEDRSSNTFASSNRVIILLSIPPEVHAMCKAKTEKTKKKNIKEYIRLKNKINTVTGRMSGGGGKEISQNELRIRHNQSTTQEGCCFIKKSW